LAKPAATWAARNDGELTMKAWVATGKPGEPLTMSDVPEPVPGPGEVVVGVEAYSVNRGEMFALNGVYGTPAREGWRPGQDIAGTVIRPAPDGSGPAVGTRVTGHPEAAGWAEQVAVPVCRLAELPDGFSGEVAAALPLAGLTALRLVRAAGNLAGRTILLTGASGGVGHYLTELAASNGAQVTAMTGSADRGRRLAELGAEAIVIDVRDATGPFDVIMESVGGETLSAAMAKLAPGGTVLWYGQAGLEPTVLDFFGLFPVTPFTLRHFPHWVSDTTDAQDLATLVRMTAAGRLHPEVGRSADWTQTAALLDDLYQRRIRGHAVLTVPGTR
jgi:NADPH:quinone reductase-like Zn-dependent oxidoreductase